MNWGFLSKLALLGFLGMVVWMVYPICACAVDSSGQEQLGGLTSDTDLHDWVYGDDRGDRYEERGTARNFLSRMWNDVTTCYGRTPIHAYEGWKLGLTGGLFIGWIVFRRIDRATWARDTKKVHGGR